MELLAFRGFLQFYLDGNSYELLTFSDNKITVKTGSRPVWVYILMGLFITAALLLVVINLSDPFGEGLSLTITAAALLLVGLLIPLLKGSRYIIIDKGEASITVGSKKFYFPEIKELAVWYSRQNQEVSATSSSSYSYQFNVALLTSEGADATIFTLEDDDRSISSPAEQMLRYLASYTGISAGQMPELIAEED